MRFSGPTSKSSTTQEQARRHEERLLFMRSMRRALAGVSMYGLHHAVAQQQVADSYEELARLLRKSGDLDLAATDEGMILNGTPVGPGHPPVQEFGKTLANLDLSDMSLLTGISRQEYDFLLETLAQTPSPDSDPSERPAERLKRKRLKSVRIRGSRYERLSDDEVVVDKSQRGSGPALRPGGARPNARPREQLRDLVDWEKAWKEQMTQGWSAQEASNTPTAPAPGVDRVASCDEAPVFEIAADPEPAPASSPAVPSEPSTDVPCTNEPVLKTPPPASGFSSSPAPAGAPAPAQPAAAPVHIAPEILAVLQDAAGKSGDAPREQEVAAVDPAELADLILRAAVTKRDETGTPGSESLGDLVAGCLRRTVEGLRNAPAASTQKGRKQTIKTIALLEKEVLEKMRILAGDDSGETQAVASSAREVKDDLQAEALAAEYAKRRKAIEQSERRILRMVRAQGAEDMEAKGYRELLAEAGMEYEDWEALVERAKRSKKRQRARAPGAPEAEPTLSGLLEGLTTLLEAADTRPADRAPQLEDAVGEVDREIGRIAWEAEQRIRDLRTSGGDGAEEDASISKRRLMHSIADIARELRQPLHVVDCSNGILLRGGTGRVNAEQRRLLELIERSTGRMELLISKLEALRETPAPASE